MSIKITNPDAYSEGNPTLAHGSFEFYPAGSQVRAYAYLSPSMAQRAPFQNALDARGLPIDHLWVDSVLSLDIVFRNRAGEIVDSGPLEDKLTILNPSAGGGGGEVTSADITDATTVGRNVLTAEDAEAARTAIGAGTSDFSGDYDDLDNKPTIPEAPTWNTLSGKPAVIAAGADAAAARAAIGAGTSSLTLGSGSNEAAPGDHGHDDATTSTPGFMSAADKAKLDGIAAGATANDTDANLLNRANHTGQQEISTITGLQDALNGKASASDLIDLEGRVAALEQAAGG